MDQLCGPHPHPFRFLNEWILDDNNQGPDRVYVILDDNKQGLDRVYVILDRFQKLAAARSRQKRDGLSNLRYELVDKTYQKLYTYIMADLGSNPS